MRSVAVWGGSAAGNNNKEYVLNILGGDANSEEHVAVLSGGVVRRIPSLDNPHSELVSLQSADVTGVCMAASSSSSLLWACTSKGQLAAWDFRASTAKPQLSSSTQVSNLSCMDVGLGGTLLACGTEEGADSRLVFWDTRRLSAGGGKVLGQYVESHSDSITSVRFHDQMFFSGSVDGLVCVFDVTKPNETSALQSVLNPNGACLKLGCFGSRGLFVCTSSETFHVYDYDSAQTIKSFDNDLYRGVGCRELLTENTGNGSSQQMEINYLIDGLWEPKTQKLLLLAGNSEGGAFGFEVTLEEGFRALGPLTGVHSEVVRCAKSHDGGREQGFNILTGGEDGIVSLWRPE